MARKTRFVLKLALAVVVMLLLGPYIFHVKLSSNLDDDAEEYKMWKVCIKKDFYSF